MTVRFAHPPRAVPMGSDSEGFGEQTATAKDGPQCFLSVKASDYVFAGKKNTAESPSAVFGGVNVKE